MTWSRPTHGQKASIVFISAWIVLFLTGRAADGANPAVERLERETGSTGVRYVERQPSPAVAVVRDFHWPGFGADPLAGALDFLASFPDLAGVTDPSTDLALAGSLTFGDETVMRFIQTYHGVPVFGRAVIVRADSTGSVDYMAGNAVPPAADIATTPALDPAEAVAIARGTVTGTLRMEPRTELMVLLDPDEATLVWAVTLSASGPAEAWVILVDAATGRPVDRFDLLFNGTGRVWEQNPVNGGLIEPEILGLTGDGTTLTGEHAIDYRYLTTADPFQSALADVDGNFLFDPSATQPVFDEPFCEVNTYYHVDRIARYFVETHGYEQTRGPLTVYANYHEGTDAEGNPTPFDNSFYDGANWTLSLGQGSTADFGYDATVVYHEYTHSVVDTLAQLTVINADIYGMKMMPGAIHEGVADYFATSLTDDPDLSEYIPLGRHMINDKKCPDDMQGLEPHDDGEVIGGTLWAVREAIGTAQADSAVYEALTLIPSDCTFKTLAEAILQAIDDKVAAGTLTDADRTAVEAIMDERGMTICDRFISIDDGETYTSSVFGLTMFGACDAIDFIEGLGYSVPSGFQWSIEVPEGSTTLQVAFDVEFYGGVEGKHWIYVRRGEPIEFELINIYGFIFPARANAYDGMFAQADGFTLTPYTDPPLEPGATYYITSSTLSCPMGEYHISAVVGDEPVPEPRPEGIEEDLGEEEPDGSAVEEAEDAAQDLDAAGEEEAEDDGGGKKGCGCRFVT
jgi:Zn-dependent metalloprotease